LIRSGVNAANVLTLFDKFTLEMMESATVVSEAKMDS
jgi:hypothetical protein